MATETRNSTNYVAIVEQLGKTTTVLVALLLVMSVCYDFAFLHALGLSFNEVPSSTSEHLRSALLWVPYIALIAAGAAFHELLSRRNERNQSEEEIAGTLGPGATWSRQSGTKVKAIGFCLTGLTIPLFATGASWLYVAFIFAWGALGMTLVKHERVRAGFSKSGALAFILLPVFLSYIAYLGSTDGAELIIAEKPSWELVLKAGNSITRQSMIGVRRFSTFAIAVDQERAVTVIPNDAILSAKKVGQLPRQEMNICRWLNLECLRALRR
jgi:hypothetical protein